MPRRQTHYPRDGRHGLARAFRAAAYEAVLERFVEWCDARGRSMFVEIPRLLCAEMGEPFVFPPPSEPPEPAPAELPLKPGAPRPVLLDRLDGRPPIPLPSLGAAARRLGVVRQRLSRHMTAGVPIAGHLVRFAPRMELAV